MSRGKRYSGEQKLNMKKVIAVIMAIVVLIMFVVVIMKLLEGKADTKDKSFALAYYTVYENDKWGVIDTKGNYMIKPTYEEMIVIPDETKPVFICTYDVNYAQGTYSSKVVNAKNETMYNQYDKVEAISNYDENNSLWYMKNILKVQKDEKYGLINMDGKELMGCQYEKIEPLVGVNSVLVTTKNGKQGLVDAVGKEIIPNEYASIQALTKQYENGFIVKTQDNQYGIIDYDKTTALETKYQDIQPVYGNHTYVVKENGTWKIIDKEGKVYLQTGFEEVKEITNHTFIIKKAGKYGIIDREGKEIVPNSYDDLTFAFENNYIAKKGNNYGMIDSTNQTKIDFIYQYISYDKNADIIRAEKEDAQTDLLDRNMQVKVTGVINQINKDKNFIRVRQGESYTYYNFKLEEKKNTELLTGNTLFLSKKDGKYGYVNEKGVVIVNYIYDDATEQNKYGYVAVKKDGKWGALDAKANTIVEPTYTLENNLVIDFIGKWHLAEDLNANYYTDRDGLN